MRVDHDVSGGLLGAVDDDEEVDVEGSENAGQTVTGDEGGHEELGRGVGVGPSGDDLVEMDEAEHAEEDDYGEDEDDVDEADGLPGDVEDRVAGAEGLQEDQVGHDEDRRQEDGVQDVRGALDEGTEDEEEGQHEDVGEQVDDGHDPRARDETFSAETTMRRTTTDHYFRGKVSQITCFFALPIVNAQVHNFMAFTVIYRQISALFRAFQ